MGRGVILLRMGDRNVMARQRFRQTAARLQARAPATPVVAAYLVEAPAGNDPTLGRAAEQLVAAGATEIAVVPYDVEWGYPEGYDVPDLLNDLAKEYPSVAFRLASTLGLGTDVDEVVAARLEAAWSHPAAGATAVRQVAAIAGQAPVITARLKDGELPTLPAHRRHVFVCFGRRCMEEGSADTYRALVARLAERGLDQGPDRVKVSRSKCLSPCQGAVLHQSGPHPPALDRGPAVAAPA